jgi:hypothetical protein|eukprot:COSAG01_NODE_3167_length_6474_cov_2.587765_9_plen_140_part_00
MIIDVVQLQGCDHIIVLHCFTRAIACSLGTSQNTYVVTAGVERLCCFGCGFALTTTALRLSRRLRWESATVLLTRSSIARAFRDELSLRRLLPFRLLSLVQAPLLLSLPILPASLLSSSLASSSSRLRACRVKGMRNPI